MDGFIGFFAGYASWNAFAWVVIAVALFAAARLVAHFTSRDLHETGVAIHGTSALIAGIAFMIGCMAGGIEADMEPTRWFDHLIVQFTPQSILINIFTAMAHLFYMPRDTD